MYSRNQKEPIPADILKIWGYISAIHGPKYYIHEHHEDNEVQGAVAHFETNPQFKEAIALRTMSYFADRGEGSIWCWFVRSRNVFLFGFERSYSWAVRRAHKNVLIETEIISSEC